MNNNYIIIGDSITYGIGDFESGGWAAMFKNYIVKKDDTKKCSNYVHVAGFPGATSTDILSKIEEFNNADKDIQEMVRLYMQLDNVTKAYFKKKMLDELKK